MIGWSDEDFKKIIIQVFPTATMFLSEVFLIMKVIFVNFSGSRGGAAIAIGRLHVALTRNGMDLDIWLKDFGNKGLIDED